MISRARSKSRLISLNHDTSGWRRRFLISRWAKNARRFDSHSFSRHGHKAIAQCDYMPNKRNYLCCMLDCLDMAMSIIGWYVMEALFHLFIGFYIRPSSEIRWRLKLGQWYEDDASLLWAHFTVNDHFVYAVRRLVSRYEKASKQRQSSIEAAKELLKYQHLLPPRRTVFSPYQNHYAKFVMASSSLHYFHCDLIHYHQYLLGNLE